MPLEAVTIGGDLIDPCLIDVRARVTHGRRTVVDDPAASTAAITIYHPDIAMPRWTVGDQVTVTGDGALRFTGEITDLDVTHLTTDRGPTAVIAVQAMGMLADLGVRYVGAAPWPLEWDTERAEHILTEAGVGYLIEGKPRVQVLPQDVDKGAAAGYALGAGFTQRQSELLAPVIARQASTGGGVPGPQGPPGPPGPAGADSTVPGPAGPAGPLDILTDVSAPATTPAGKFLGTTATGVWEPVDPPHGGGGQTPTLRLNDLQDVTIPNNVATGQVLAYKGNHWEPEDLPAAAPKWLFSNNTHNGSTVPAGAAIHDLVLDTGTGALYEVMTASFMAKKVQLIPAHWNQFPAVP